MFSPIASEIVAISGYDTVIIDLEHSPGSFIDAISSMQAVSNYDCPAMIRASSSGLVDIKRALDIGPEGIMIPDVRNVEHTKQVVEACRYGPAGNRGAAPGIIRATKYGENLEGYLEFMEQDFLLMVQIESKEAVNDIENIVRVDGIDMVFIGPADLSASLGDLHNFDSAEFNQAFDHIVEASLGTGKLLGTIPIPGRDAQHLYQTGHHLVVSGTDTMLLQKAAKEDVAAMKKATSRDQ